MKTPKAEAQRSQALRRNTRDQKQNQKLPALVYLMLVVLLRIFVPVVRAGLRAAIPCRQVEVLPGGWDV